MGLVTIPFRKIEEHTEDIFEAVTVISERARRIIGDRYVIEAERRREEENLEEISGEDEIAPAYQVENELDQEAFDRVVKPTSQSLSEFLSGDLKWDKLAMFVDSETDAEADSDEDEG
ncbi:hypothetical protein HQ531_06545 [bacterium]|nr:hypothetical protein [bacterium]